ncbi:MAG TPA: 4Fe-4S binding protein [Clostridia bacterium]|nr:[Fe-Fe] hydrogenase large subunit C-terminal domain-containing protein [Clostridia bacterium]HHY05677.1 4Fe-4S binding protein [Clostridia bacterium]
MNSYFHSVTLDKELCRGCTNCIKRCPTEAIRVREGKAKIIDERCIDCGECIRICPHHAKLALTDTLESIKKYKYPIALPAPSLYAQFNSQVPINHILAGLLELGFYRVWEVAYGAEFVSRAINQFLQKNNFVKPAISAACPAVLRLIQVKFPELINQVIPLKSPMEVTATLVREKMAKEGYSSEEVGVFFISPCAAKVTAVKNPLGMSKSAVDGVIGISGIYGLLRDKVEKIQEAPELQKATEAGVSWAVSGGESNLLTGIRRLAVDGIANVSKVLEEVVMGKLKEVDFIEGLACTGGCVGGPLTVENPFMAKERIHNLVNSQPKELPELPDILNWQDLTWEKKITPLGVLRLDEDMAMALQKMELLETLQKDLPGLDCGSCGAPTCRALAEDIVRGQADEVDCVFKLREKVTDLAEKMVQISSKMPPSIGKKE